MTDFSDIMKAMSDPRTMAQMELGAASKEYMERSLIMLQMMYFAKELFGPEEASKMMKPYHAAMSLLGEHMNEAVEKFQKEHGEI